MLTERPNIFNRDGFYELIREWEECHMMPNWNMSEVLGHRIRGLVTYKTDLANHIHFARLFQSQLIAVSSFLALIISLNISSYQSKTYTVKCEIS